MNTSNLIMFWGTGTPAASPGVFYTTVTDGTWDTLAVWSPTPPTGGPAASDWVCIKHDITISAADVTVGAGLTGWTGATCGVLIGNIAGTPSTGKLRVIGKKLTLGGRMRVGDGNGAAGWLILGAGAEVCTTTNMDIEFNNCTFIASGASNSFAKITGPGTLMTGNRVTGSTPRQEVELQYLSFQHTGPMTMTVANGGSGPTNIRFQARNCVWYRTGAVQLGAGSVTPLSTPFTFDNCDIYLLKGQFAFGLGVIGDATGAYYMKHCTLQSPPIVIQSLSRTGSVVTCTTVEPHKLNSGNTPRISNCSATDFHTSAAVSLTYVNETQFTYWLSGASAQASQGYVGYTRNWMPGGTRHGFKVQECFFNGYRIGASGVAEGGNLLAEDCLFASHPYVQVLDNYFTFRESAAAQNTFRRNYVFVEYENPCTINNDYGTGASGTANYYDNVWENSSVYGDAAEVMSLGSRTKNFYNNLILGMLHNNIVNVNMTTNSDMDISHYKNTNFAYLNSGSAVGDKLVGAAIFPHLGVKSGSQFRTYNNVFAGPITTPIYDDAPGSNPQPIAYSNHLVNGTLGALTSWASGCSLTSDALNRCLVANPHFSASWRKLSTWDSWCKGPGTSDNVRNEFGRLNGFNYVTGLQDTTPTIRSIKQLVLWVKSGYDAFNPALRKSGSPVYGGGQIGAGTVRSYSRRNYHFRSRNLPQSGARR